MGKDLERAAGTVKDVLCWETPGESYAEAQGLSSIVDCWDKSPWQLGAKPELQNMPLLATAHSAVQKQARQAVVSEVKQKTRKGGETQGQINSWDVQILGVISKDSTCSIHCEVLCPRLGLPREVLKWFENASWQFSFMVS